MSKDKKQSNGEQILPISKARHDELRKLIGASAKLARKDAKEQVNILVDKLSKLNWNQLNILVKAIKIAVKKVK
jgi:hypothetical protein